MSKVLALVLALCAAGSCAVLSAVEPMYVPYNNTNSTHNSTHTNRTILINLNLADLPLTKIGDKSYYIDSTSKVNWFTALNFCRSKNLNLASINSAQENEELSAHLAQFGTKFWVSLNNLAKEDEWVWSGTGTKESYTNWDVGEPNNLGGNENCTEVRAPTDQAMKWNDLDCGYHQLSFICEESAQNAPVPQPQPQPNPEPEKENSVSNTQYLFTKVFSWTWTKVF